MVTIDKKISKLVSCFNGYGFETYASCQGHGFPIDKIKPYIAFRAPLENVARLEQILRQDAESIKPRLNWGWWISASFNEKFELCYRLNLANSGRRYYRYWRPTLDQDIEKLKQLLELYLYDLKWANEAKNK